MCCYPTSMVCKLWLTTRVLATPLSKAAWHGA